MLLNCKKLLNYKCYRNLATISNRNLCVLGIETSCDDTGIAVVRHENGQNTVLANVLNSQQSFHIRYGGIIPPRAQDLHRSKIANVFERCLKESNLKAEDIDAIAVTTRPGLPLSLLVGLRFARYVARLYNKPLIPVHHMKAHALQARMEYDIPYPFLCLLISGGHSQLCFVKSAEELLLLGESLDDAPGEAFDKIARRLRLYINPKYTKWNGGQIIEDAAKYATNPEAFEFPLPLARMRDCNFSFAGIKNNSFRAIRRQELKEACPPDSVITNYADFCAGLLNAISRHLMNRTQRALEFCIERNFFGSGSRSLVVSGGVANNDTIYHDISHLAEQFECKTYRPSKRNCSDNGVMIAWNGIEQVLRDKNCLRWDYNDIDIQGKAELGKSLINEVTNASIKCKWIHQNRS
ncbi:probable tRNA N6-adenosine threonylcarbamoyltransferase, mitochondrial [Lucilia cuprina]|uniref:probable tRNA N6-adenosine threonylcarbamoyltransferase, mitochondrial n=1 Tax=Lucilia cuprina TaxID=7375 RepID=UPI001F05569B|nr:probable tRNA N6-adenosine threonylcarbamoyltransferase, mitochondrial [Lucilia cuprina]